MGVRAWLTGPGRWLVTGGAILAVVLAGMVVFYSLRTPPTPGMADAVLVQCVDPACGFVKETTMQWASDNWEASEQHPIAPGATCEKCGKKSMAFVAKCPNDGTMVFREKIAARLFAEKNTPAFKAISEQPQKVCPKCKWDPAEKVRRKLEEKLRRK